MKILLVGSWRFGLYQPTLARGLRLQGAEVVPFETSEFFKPGMGWCESYLCIRGLAHIRCERALLRACAQHRPDVVFVWQYDMLTPDCIRAIRAINNPVVVCYTNDDPFSELYNTYRSIYVRRRWKMFRQALPEFDLHYVFRERNIRESLEAGARSAEVLMMYFDPLIHHPRPPDPAWESDVAFVGHFEDDMRLPALLALKRSGVRVRLNGNAMWDKPASAPIRKAYGRITPLWGEDYAKALAGASICLCFLSRLNRDEYTTRTFEIPACGSLLMAERTPAHQRLFKENEEAVFFSSAEELVDKVENLLKDKDRMKKIARMGYERVLSAGCSVDDRARQILTRMDELTRGRSS